MSACAAKFALKFCDCLPDPMNPGATICGYVNKQNGLVYPCDVGCCAKCPNQGVQPSQKIELRKSKGTTLPPGFGQNLTQSDLPTEPKGSTPFQGEAAGGAAEDPFKVWQIFLVLFVLLAFAVASLVLA
jgi:hypothetical protein